MSLPWKPLNLHQGDIGVPPLLVKSVFSPTSYTIYITDLTYIWAESLDRKQLFRRALNLDTSIDPSEGSDQLALLLQNIQRSLDGEEDTTLSLNVDQKGSNLILYIHARLPVPLRPLEWPIQLALNSPECLANQFVLPCLSQQLTAHDQVNLLLSKLREKDQVISRLIESMQSVGTDFSRVFPGAGALKVGAGSDVRNVLGRSVKGLQVFNSDKWQQDHLPGLTTPIALETLVHTVFLAKPIPFLPPPTQACYGKWWNMQPKIEKLGTENIPSTQSNKPTTPHDLAIANKQSPLTQTICEPKGLPNETTLKTIGQESPRKKVVEPNESSGIDVLIAESVTDDSDQDLETKSSRPKLEGYDKSRKTGHPEDSSRRSPFSTKEKFSVSQEHSLPERIRKENSSIAASPPYSVYDLPNAKPRAKLGRIGGKSKQTSDANRTTNTAASPKRGRDHDGEIDRGRSDQVSDSLNQDTKLHVLGEARPTMSTPPVRETSQERADRKRVELKRELDDRSKVAGKKKRKF